MTKQAERELAWIALRVDDLRDSLHRTGDFEARARLELVASIEEIAGRLRQVAPVDDVPVSVAAGYLGVSQPTVRSWAKRGLLTESPRAKPLRIQADSLQRLRRSLDELRARGQDRDWLASLSDYLEDIADRRSDAVRLGLKELQDGELEPA